MNMMCRVLAEKGKTVKEFRKQRQWGRKKRGPKACAPAKTHCSVKGGRKGGKGVSSVGCLAKVQLPLSQD